MNPESAWLEALKLLPTAKTIHIAYSGGMDSHVLLHSLCQLRQNHPLPPLHAVHIHHGLNPQADQWAIHCQTVCETLGLDCDVVSVAVVEQDKLGPEQAARRARYAALSEQMQPDDWLVTAHHQNDQAETLLLQLFRGAGPDGLAAMASCQPFAKGLHVRPLLQFKRSDLTSYASEHQLHWIEDDSNANVDYDRNYLRHQLLPLIEQRWPSIVSTIARSAQICGESANWIHNHVGALLIDQPPAQLPLDVLKAQDGFIQKALFRAWLKRAGVRMPNQRRLHDMLQQCLDVPDDRQPVFELDGVQIQRFQGVIYLLRNLPVEPFDYSIPWEGQVCVLPDSLGQLRVRSEIGQGIADEHWQLGAFVEICSRRGGESIRLPGREGHRSLKKIYQESQVPTWLRTRTPILKRGDVVLAVADSWVNEDYAAREDQPGWVVEWDAPWRND